MIDSSLIEPQAIRERIEMIDLRCDGTMHGRLDLDRGTIEVKCGRRRCGASKQVVVLHIFSILTGEMIDTRRFANPPSPRKEATRDTR